MKKIILTLFVAICLSACSNKAKEDIGLSAKAPDATKSEVRPSLILPPNYNMRPVVKIPKASMNIEKE